MTATWKNLLERSIPWIVGFFALALLVLLMLPAPSAIRPQGRLNGCCHNIRMITRAIVAYAKDRGHLPPPYVTDDTGTPLHSWRVLILPYLEELDLYKEYDFDQPWDSDHNLSLRAPDVYRCPSDTHKSCGTHSGYVVMIGDETAWPTSRRRVLTDVADTDILVLETFHARQHWLDPTSPAIGDVEGKRIRLISEHERGVVVAGLKNGDHRYLGFDYDGSKLLAALTVETRTAQNESGQNHRLDPSGGSSVD